MTIAEALDTSRVAMQLHDGPASARSDLGAALRAARRALARARIPAVLVGGIALARYLSPRATKDVDVAVLAVNVGGAQRALERAGFRATANPGVLHSLGGAQTLRMRGPRMRNVALDVLASRSRFFVAVQKLARRERAFGWKVASREALLVMKLVAHQSRRKSAEPFIRLQAERDLLDAKELLQSGASVPATRRLATLLGVRLHVPASRRVRASPRRRARSK